MLYLYIDISCVCLTHEACLRMCNGLPISTRWDVLPAEGSPSLLPTNLIVELCLVPSHDPPQPISGVTCAVPSISSQGLHPNRGRSQSHEYLTSRSREFVLNFVSTWS